MSEEVRREVNLPKWDLYTRIETGSGKNEAQILDTVSDTVGDGYIVAKFDEKQSGGESQGTSTETETYLLVMRDGYICEVGTLKGTDRISKSFFETRLNKIREKVNNVEGTLSVYELPGEMCEVLCEVINEKPVHENLNTNIVDTDSFVEELKNEGFTGLVTFTNRTTFAYIRFYQGGFEEFWHEGIKKIDNINEFLEIDSSDLEINVVETDRKKSDFYTPSTTEKSDTSQVSPNYAAIADIAADSVADVTGREYFYRVLDENIENIDEARIENQTLYVEDDSAKDPVFHAIFETIEKTAGLVPIWKTLDEVKKELEGVEGKEEFLDMYDSDVDGRLV